MEIPYLWWNPGSFLHIHVTADKKEREAFIAEYLKTWQLVWYLKCMRPRSKCLTCWAFEYSGGCLSLFFLVSLCDDSQGLPLILIFFHFPFFFFFLTWDWKFMPLQNGSLVICSTRVLKVVGVLWTWGKEENVLFHSLRVRGKAGLDLKVKHKDTFANFGLQQIKI